MFLIEHTFLSLDHCKMSKTSRGSGLSSHALELNTSPPLATSPRIRKRLTANWLTVCSTCGVSVGVSPKKELESQMPVRPINVRTMDGVDLEKLSIKKVDGWSREPQYEAR